MKSFLILFIFLFGSIVAADDDDHEHSREEPAQSESKEHPHGDDDDLGNEEEVGSTNPGIPAIDKELGFKLSDQAKKNFSLSFFKVTQAQVQIPKSAIVYALNEINVFRFRDGFFKRIDFEGAKGNVDSLMVTITSKDLKSGDQIAISGVGFLRIAEIAAFGGVSEGHSH